MTVRGGPKPAPTCILSTVYGLLSTPYYLRTTSFCVARKSLTANRQ